MWVSLEGGHAVESGVMSVGGTSHDGLTPQQFMNKLTACTKDKAISYYVHQSEREDVV